MNTSIKNFFPSLATNAKFRRSMANSRTGYAKISQNESIKPNTLAIKFRGSLNNTTRFKFQTLAEHFYIQNHC